MINLGAFLLIPLGASIEFFSKKIIGAVILKLVIIGGITLNLYQSKQYEIGTIHYEGMTWETYKSVWMNDRPTFEFYDQLEPLDGALAMNGIDAVHRKVYDTIQAFDLHTKQQERIPAQTYSGNFRMPVNEATVIVAEAKIRDNIDSLTIFCAPFGAQDCSIQPFGVTSLREDGSGFILRSYYRFEQENHKCDSIQFFFLNPKKAPTLLKEFKAWGLTMTDTLIDLE